VNERALVITNDGRILKLDPTKKFKTMLKANMVGDFSHKIGISPDGNQVVVIHLNASAGNDLVLSLATSGDRIGELVAVLAARLAKVQPNGRGLNVTASNAIQFRSGKSSKLININATTNSGTFMKTKDGGVTFNA
jgi:hypothetical protein